MNRGHLRRRVIDYLVYIVSSVVLVSAYWWAMMNDRILKEDIEKWGGLILSTVVLAFLVAPIRRRGVRPGRFWGVFLGLLAVRIVLLRWVLWSLLDGRGLVYCLVLPIEMVWMRFVLTASGAVQKQRHAD